MYQRKERKSPQFKNQDPMSDFCVLYFVCLISYPQENKNDYVKIFCNVHNNEIIIKISIFIIIKFIVR